MLLEHEQNYDLGMDALPYALGTRTELWFGHECSGHRMLLEHERNYDLGMDALVNGCSWNTNGIMFWAWMFLSADALGTPTEIWFGHGCSGQRMLLEHERNYDLGIDALVSVCSGNTNGVMGECPWSPGTWRRWSQTPSIPLNKPRLRFKPYTLNRTYRGM